MGAAVYLARLAHPADFEGWRVAARDALALDLPPERIAFAVDGDPAPLFGEPMPEAPTQAEAVNVPRAFPELARQVVCHSDDDRFLLLYRLLWRLAHENRHLLDVATDPDVMRARSMTKAVYRDAHKMKAFVRFREVPTPDGGTHSIAWFEPFHHVVELTAPFFMRRFPGMVWSIVTPRRSVHWDGEALSFAPGGSAADRPADDAAEALWLTYYASIFNPARLKVKAMQAEMPKKYWHNLPEAALIAPLIRGAEEASRRMLATAPTLPSFRHEKQAERDTMARAAIKAPATMEAFGGFNRKPEDIEEAREQAKHCKACPLWEPATQTVFGEGPADASVIFVGEQPGDQEDLAGHPFVGPAGKVFNEALANAGIDRAQAYVTNAVKHFKFEPRGKRRIHSKPSMGEVKVCRWWLELERELIAPKLIVALGATAAAAVLGRTVTIRDTRSKLIDLPGGDTKLLVTVHPAYILRLPDPEAQAREREAFFADMARAKDYVPQIALAA
ncbi:UdgX family uracil-DNA binding protein [Antarcticirhabdus aurantiaca]|uniref:UdgX family uracil-DNA binding protein n=1 Tax=Antarcticirhabdus aurantiaca TaxID=2606717 RepID=A0ACD4NSI6_9HYPH|nr:UdgX family uracil-DNA binding protein [Antarcticirhabdus aurantiaca]WAJ29724.1 UdgX family uracil-DNA binding protein [Jeongeuplla avenae]